MAGYGAQVTKWGQHGQSVDRGTITLRRSWSLRSRVSSRTFLSNLLTVSNQSLPPRHPTHRHHALLTKLRPKYLNVSPH